MAAVDLKTLLEDVSDHVSAELESSPEVLDDPNPDVDDLPIVARRWHRVESVVAVVADLKNSTRLGLGKWAASTASIYEAGTGGVVRIVDGFGVDFVQIQGDGVLALFWGDLRFERALCAAITMKSFSTDLADQLDAKWPGLEPTGYKIGVACGRVLVKRVGVPRKQALQEPIWPGKPLNYATKAAQCGDRHELVVTGSVWERIRVNDYLAFSCSCGDGPSDTIWKPFVIAKLPDGDGDRDGRLLTSQWCKVHGTEFCDSILLGKKQREDTKPLRRTADADRLAELLRRKATADKADSVRLKGLR